MSSIIATRTPIRRPLRVAVHAEPIIVPRKTIRRPVCVERTRSRRMEQKVFRTIVEMACEMSHAERGRAYIAFARACIAPALRLPHIYISHHDIPYYGARLYNHSERLGLRRHLLEEGVNSLEDSITMSPSHSPFDGCPMTKGRVELLGRNLEQRVSFYIKSHGALSEILYRSD